MIELVGQRLIIEAGLLFGSARIAVLRNRCNHVGRTALTTPGSIWQIDRGVGLRRNDVLMRDETLVELRLKHFVGEHPLVRHVEVWLRLAMRNVNVLRMLQVPRIVPTRFVVEAVHAAFRSWKRAGSATRREHRLGGVIDDVISAEARRHQLDRLAVRVLTLRNGVGAGIPLEEIVEAAVLLHDVDDVLDFARPGRI